MKMTGTTLIQALQNLHTTAVPIFFFFPLPLLHAITPKNLVTHPKYRQAMRLRLFGPLMTEEPSLPRGLGLGQVLRGVMTCP